MKTAMAGPDSARASWLLTLKSLCQEIQGYETAKVMASIRAIALSMATALET